MSDEIRKRALRLEDTLPRLMRTMYRPNMTDALRDLPVAQLRMLRVLFPAPKSHSAVSDELGISVSAVTQVANRLEVLRLVERVEDPQDRRVKNLQLTAYAMDCMRKRLEYRIDRTMLALGALPESRQKELLSILEELIQGMQALRESETGPVLAADLALTGGLPLIGGDNPA